MTRKFGIIAAVVVILILTAPVVFAESESDTGGGGAILPLPTLPGPPTVVVALWVEAQDKIEFGKETILGTIYIYVLQTTILLDPAVDVTEGKARNLSVSNMGTFLNYGLHKLVVKGKVVACSQKKGIAWELSWLTAKDKYGYPVEFIVGLPIGASSYVVKKAKPNK